MENYRIRSTQSAATELLHYVKQQATGRLVIAHRSGQYYFDLFQGRLSTAVLSTHRRRRWRRAVDRQVPQLGKRLQPRASKQNWERSHLHHGVSEGWLTNKQANGILTDCAREVLFSLMHISKARLYWQPSNSPLRPHWTLSVRTLTTLYEEVQELSQNWQELELKPEWVHQAAELDSSLNLSSSVFPSLRQSLDGKHCFWDLISDFSVSPATVSRILHHFLEQGIIQLAPLQDLPAPDPRDLDFQELDSDSEATSKLEGHISYIPEVNLA